MHCLLCHEKIPRLRAWTGKSEFCCDEHAELYKKQTIDRLLVDDSVVKAAAPLPTSGGEPIGTSETPSVDNILLKGQASKSKRTQDVQEAGDVDELWRLADSMGGQKEKPPPLLSQEAPTRGPDDIQSQSADEALAALQALAAEASQTKRSDGDLLDEFSRMESSFEGFPSLESLRDELDEAPELELDALEWSQKKPPASAEAEPGVQAPELELDSLEWSDTASQANANAEPAAQAADSDAIDAPDLDVEELAQEEEESLAPPELAADYDAEEAESLEPPDAAWEELHAVAGDSDGQRSELADPPEPADLEPAELEPEALAEADTASPAPGPAPRRSPKAAPRLRPATELQDMAPSPCLPEGDSALEPWEGALVDAGPDSGILLGPSQFTELRKSSLNGTASAKFDPVELQASERIAAVNVPIAEPEGVAYEPKNEALMPSPAFAWPTPLYATLFAAEMGPDGTAQSLSTPESFFSVKQPTLSSEFLNRVALKSRILEPECSAITSPLDRGALASPAEEEESGSEYASAAGCSDTNRTDGGERADVADLF